MPLIQSVRDQEEKKKRQAAPVKAQKPSYSGVDATRTTGAWNTRHGLSGTSGSRYEQKKYNYSSKPQNDWDQAQYCAYFRTNNIQEGYDYLANESQRRGSLLYNPYRSGAAVLPEFEEQTLRSYLNYDGPFDTKFFNDYSGLFESLNYQNYSFSAKSPTKKSSPDEWAAYCFNKLSSYQKETEETNQQFEEVRTKFQDYANQFTKIHGRIPTLEEFASAVDISKYGRLKAIAESLPADGKYLNEKTPQVLTTGTFYSPDIIAGLYYAWANGEDITIDRDYFEDAVQYWMAPEKAAGQTQRYDWSGSDLSQWTPDDQQKYLDRLNAEGKREEYAAFKWACWEARPHDDSITAEMSTLDAAYGQYHDDKFFNSAHAGLDDEMKKRRLADGTMPRSLKTKGDLMDRTCYALYELDQLRGDTDEAQQGFNSIVSEVEELFKEYARNDFEWRGGYEEFHETAVEKLDNYLKENLNLKHYLDNSDNPAYIGSHFCREMPMVSRDNFDSICRRIWDSKPINTDVDYTAVNDDEYEPPVVSDTPAETPLFYEEQQRSAVVQRANERNAAEEAIQQAAVDLSESGAHIPIGYLHVLNATLEKYVDRQSAKGKDFLGTLGKLWADFQQSLYANKLGEGYSTEEMIAIDPVLSQLETKNFPKSITVGDVYDVLDAYVDSKINDDDITLADGIIGNVIPNSDKLFSIMVKSYADIRDGNEEMREFDAGVYRGMYDELVTKGYSDEDAISIAYFGATAIKEATERIGTTYDGDTDLEEVAGRLVADMAAEEGATDSVELFKAINDDVKDVVKGLKDKAASVLNNGLSKLNEALMLGSSEEAPLGFRALTNDVVQGIASGDITPEDVVSGMAAADGVSMDAIFGPSTGPAENQLALGKDFEFTPATEIGPMYTLANGEEITKQQYRDVVLGELKPAVEKADSLFSGPDVFANLSETAKQVIHYDDLVAAAKEEYGDSTMAINSFIRDACEAYTNPDKRFHTNPLNLDTDSDNLPPGETLISMAQALGQNKTPEEIAANKEKASIKHFTDSQQYDLIPTILSYFGMKNSDSGNLINFFETYGKWFASQEVDAMLNAYYNGEATSDEVMNLAYKRINTQDETVINARANPAMLQQSYNRLESAYEKLIATPVPEEVPSAQEIVQNLIAGEDMAELAANYPTMFANVDMEGVQSLLDTRQFMSDEELTKQLGQYFNENQNAELGTTYTQKQRDAIRRLLDMYESTGANGHNLANFDNDVLAEHGVVDLDAAGFEGRTAASILSELDPNWDAAYKRNPGSNKSTLVSGLSSGLFTPFIKLPANIANQLRLGARELASMVTGASVETIDAFAPKNGLAANIKNTSDIQRGIEESERQESAHNRTKLQKLGYTTISEVARNVMSGVIGGSLGNMVANYIAPLVSGLKVNVLGGMTGIGYIDDVISGYVGLANHSMLALTSQTSAFNEEYYAKGKPFFAAFNTSMISAATELWTESPMFERFSSMSFGGWNLTNLAKRGADKLGHSGLAWVANAINANLAEINEEEASLILGDAYETIYWLTTGDDLGTAIAKGFEGVDKEFVTTAYSTFLTTSVLGAIDLGGATYNYVIDSRTNNRAIDLNELFKRTGIDLASAKDAESVTPEQIRQKEAEGVQKYLSFDASKRVPQWGKTGENNVVLAPEPKLPQRQSETQELDVAQEIASEPLQGTSEPTSSEGIQNTSEAVEPSETMQDNAKTEPVSDSEQAAATASEKAQATLTEAVKDLMRTPSDETQEKVIAASEEMLKAREVDIVEETKQKAEETKKGLAAPEPEEVKPEPILTTGAQKVKDLMDAREDAKDEAIISKGAKMAAEKAIAEDEGLQRKQANINKAMLKIEASEKEIANLQQEAQIISNQLAQGFRAAVDSGIDLESQNEIKTNLQISKQTEQAAKQSKAAEESKKLEALKAQAEEEKAALEKEKDRQFKETIEKAGKDYAEKVATKRAELFSQHSAEELLTGKSGNEVIVEQPEMIEDENGKKKKGDLKYDFGIGTSDEQELNKRQAEAEGLDVNSLFTNEQGEQNRQAVQAEQEARMGDYARRIKQEGAGLEATEEYVNPNSYTNTPTKELGGLTPEALTKLRNAKSDDERDKILNDSNNYTIGKGGNPRLGRQISPNVTEVRSEEWQDEAKNNEEARILAEEREARMLGDYLTYQKQKKEVRWVQIPVDLFKILNKVTKNLPGPIDSYSGENRRFLYKAEGDLGRPAQIASQRSGWEEIKTKKNGEVKKIKHFGRKKGAKGFQPKTNKTDYVEEDFLYGRGMVSGLAYRAIMQADPNFEKRAGTAIGRNGFVGPKLAYYNENSRFLILQTMNEGLDEDAKAEKDKYFSLIKPGDDGKTGLQRGQEQVDELQSKVDYFAKRVLELEKKKEDLTNKLGEAKNDKARDKIIGEIEKAYEEAYSADNSYKFSKKKLDEAATMLANQQTFVKGYKYQKAEHPKTFYIIDKEGLMNAPKPKDIYKASVLEASDLTPDMIKLSKDEIIEMLRKDAAKKIIPMMDEEDFANIDKAADSYVTFVTSNYDKMDEGELKVELYHHLIQEKADEKAPAQYDKIVGVIHDKDVKKATNRVHTFMETHGGIATDGFGGAGFTSFLDRDKYRTSGDDTSQYPSTMTYFATEEACLKYLTPEQQKAIRLNPECGKYNAKVEQSVKEFGEANNLSETDMAGLISTLSVDADDPRRIGSAVIVDNDDEHFLGIPSNKENDFTKNKLIRTNGSLSTAKAKRQVQSRLAYIADAIAREEGNVPRNGVVEKFDSSTHSIQAFYYDEKGVLRSKKVGEMYPVIRDGKTVIERFIPSYDELMSKYNKVVCNFPGYTDGRQYNPKMNFTLFMQSGSNIMLKDEVAKALKFVPLSNYDDPLNHTRGLDALQHDIEALEDLIAIFGEAPGEIRYKLEKAYRTTQRDQALFLYKSALEEVKNAKPELVKFWQNEVASAKVNMELADKLLREAGKYKPFGSFEWVKEAQKKYMSDEERAAYNKQLASRRATPKSASETYEMAKEQYEKLTDKDGAFADDSYYDAQRAALAAVMPDLKKNAEDEKVKQAEEPAAPPEPEEPEPMPIDLASEVEKLDNKMRLAVLKDLSDLGMDVGDLRRKAIAEFHDEATKNMTDEEKVAYYGQIAERAKTNPNDLIMDMNVDYDAIAGEIVQNNLKKNDDRIKKNIANILAKAPSRGKSWVKRDLNKLVEYGNNGYDVSEAIAAVQKRASELMKPHQAVKSQIIDAEKDPEIKKDKQVLAAETQAEAVANIMDTMPASIQPTNEQIFDEDLREILNPTQEQTTEEQPEDNKTQPAVEEQTAQPESSTRTKMSGLEEQTTNTEATQPLGMMEAVQSASKDTQFNSMVDAINEANALIYNEESFNSAMVTIANTVAKIENLNGMINDVIRNQREAEHNKFTAENQLMKLRKDNKLNIRDSKVSDQYDKAAQKLTKILDQIEELLDRTNHQPAAGNADMYAALQRDLAETEQLMSQIEATSFTSLTNEQRRQLGSFLNQIDRFSDKIAKKEKQASSLVVERNEAKEKRDKLGHALARSETAQRIIRQRTSWKRTDFGDEKSKTPNFKEVYAQRLTDAKNAAKKLMENMKASGKMIHGDASIFSIENLADALKNGILTDDALSFGYYISMGTSQTVKSEKKAAALLKFGIAKADNMRNRTNNAALAQARDEAVDAIFGLTRLTGYSTEEDKLKEKDAREKAKATVEEYDQYLSNNVLSGDLVHAEELLRYQLAVIENDMERIEKTVRDYFSLSSTADILSALTGENGGMLPQPIMDILVGAVHNATTKKNGKNKKIGVGASLSRYLRAFDVFVTDTLGEYAPIVNTLIVNPVMIGEKRATDWLRSMDEQMKQYRVKDGEEAKAMGHILNDMMTDADIRNAYPKMADTLIRAKNAYVSSFQQAIDMMNPVLARNGEKPMKWVKGYFSHTQEERNPIYRFLGLSSKADELPTGLAGATEDTKPGHQFASFTLKRHGASTEGINWDANQVWENYMKHAAAILYQTDNIHRMNDFITALGGNHERTGDQDVDFAANSPLSYNTLGELAKRNNYSLFVTALERFRDQVAGKKTGHLDRAVENAATRSALTAIQALTKVQSVAKVGGNFKSVALNTLPMMDSFCFHPAESLSASAEVWDWKNRLFDHPDLSRSNFFMARCGRERKAASTFDKATKTLFIPMDVSDRISTATVWLGNYRSLLKQLGGDEQQAIVMADSMTKRMMSSKLRGDKGEAYNSSVGSMFLQFTQEAVNRVGFIFGKDARRYSHGLGRAIATIFGVFVSSFLVNKLAGANSTFDAIDIGWDAFKKRREGEDFKTVLGEAVTSFIDQLNPIDNLTSGNLFEAPSISAVSDVLGSAENAAWSTLGWIMDAAVEIGDYVFNGDEVEIPGFGLDWAKQLGNGLLGWVPGSTQGKRMVDAVKSYVRGYATNQRGNVKFETDGPFAVPKLGQALLFGVNAQPAGQKYVKEGYKGWKDDDWAKVENLKGHYGSYHEAVKHFNADKERTSEIGEIDEKEKWGEATSEDLAKRESLYNDRGLPSDASAYFMENADTDWAKKALKLSNENNGARTYPTKLPIQTDTKRGVKYFVYDKHNYEISDEIAEKMLEDYNYEAKKAIIGAKDAKALASELSGLVKKIKERYINEAGE